MRRFLCWFWFCTRKLDRAVITPYQAWSVNVECQGTAQGMSEPFSTGDLQEAPPLTDAKLATI